MKIKSNLNIGRIIISEISKLAWIKYSCIILILLTKTSILHAQVTKQSFSLSILPCVSFSSSIKSDDNSIIKTNPISLTPLISYSFLSKKNILNIGLRIHYSGITLKYSNSLLEYPSNYSYSSYFLSPSFSFYKPVLKKLYIGCGLLISYAPEASIFTSNDTFAETTINVKKGIKYNLLFGFKYAFKIKSRTLSCDLTFIKGISTYFNAFTNNNFTNYQNRYIHKGSCINLGMTYYFGAKSKVYKVRQKLNKSLP